jgi:hypothetical protein
LSTAMFLTISALSLLVSPSRVSVPRVRGSTSTNSTAYA